MYSLGEVRERTRDWNQPMLWLAYAMAALALVSLVGLAVDDRVIAGMPIWAKPLKFALSVLLYAVTWAWLASLATRAPRLVRRMSAATAGLVALEIALIVGQILRGRQSHFNVETAFDAAVFGLMGMVISAAWFGTLVLTIVLMRSEIADAATRWAIRLGAALSLVGMALAFLMTGPTGAQVEAIRSGQDVARIGAHAVGADDGGPGLPILGWSTTAGDLRIPHFVGLHALQVLPLLALGLGMVAARWPALRAAAVRLRLVVVASAGYAGLVALVLWQALRGQPLIYPDGWTLTAFAALVVAVAAGGGWALRAVPQTTPQAAPREVAA